MDKLWVTKAVNIQKKKSPRHHYNLTKVVNEHSTANILAKRNEPEFIKP